MRMRYYCNENCLSSDEREKFRDGSSKGREE
jgi:hypothetical protein